MSVIVSKWPLVLLLLFLLLAVLYFLGRKSVHHEINVSAEPETVWSVLTDTQSYPEWNPVMVKVKGELGEGQKLTYTFRQDQASEYDIPATVKKIDPPRLLNQVGGMPGILSFDHRYVLEPTGAGTKVTIHEDYRGIGVPFWNPAPVELAYRKLNEALRDRVVKLAGE